ncbi:MAG: cation-transporting P-type ATPase, partial [Stackebrandtia sp.]
MTNDRRSSEPVEPATGLTMAEAARRMATWGPNAAPQPPPPNLLRRVLSQ